MAGAGSTAEPGIGAHRSTGSHATAPGSALAARCLCCTPPALCSGPALAGAYPGSSCLSSPPHSWMRSEGRVMKALSASCTQTCSQLARGRLSERSDKRRACTQARWCPGSRFTGPRAAGGVRQSLQHLHGCGTQPGTGIHNPRGIQHTCTSFCIDMHSIHSVRPPGSQTRLPSRPWRRRSGGARWPWRRCRHSAA